MPGGMTIQSGVGLPADASLANAKLANMAQSTIKGRAAAAGTGVPTDLSAAQVMTLLGIVVSTYTPTLTNTTNVAASTAYEARYIQIDNQVTVFFKVDVDPTSSAASTVLGISLPVASNLTGDSQLSGTAAGITTAGEVAGIVGDTTNDRATMQWITSTTANHSMNGSFNYVVQ